VLVFFGRRGTFYHSMATDETNTGLDEKEALLTLETLSSNRTGKASEGVA